MIHSVLANARLFLRKARGPRRSVALLIMFAVSIACLALDSHSQVPGPPVNRPRLIDLKFDRPQTVGNPESVEDFLKRTRQAIDDGADIEAEDEYGNTPLLNATGWVAWSSGDWGANRIVALLLERGANPNQTHRNAYRMTPLHIASSPFWPNVELIEMLCAAGADKTAVATDGFGTPYEMTLRMDHPLSSGPPHAAGHLALIQLALKNCGQKK